MIELDKIKEALDNAKIVDVSMFDLKSTNPFFNYVVVGTANNKRQLQASLKYIEEAKVKYDHIEGEKNEDWLLIDCGDILINIMSQKARAEYSLDSLYKEFKF